MEVGVKVQSPELEVGTILVASFTINLVVIGGGTIKVTIASVLEGSGTSANAFVINCMAIDGPTSLLVSNNQPFTKTMVSLALIINFSQQTGSECWRYNDVQK